MLNKWTILFQIKEARDRRIRIINRRTMERLHPLIVEMFFHPSPLLSRLREK